jgi:hypothetical protein
MTANEQRVAILGAGFAGLGVAASLRRHGIAYDQFEANEDLGGSWYRGVYASAHMITSKKTTAYAGFPMPRDYPLFPSRAQVLDYLRAFAEHHCLRESITFRARVMRVEPVSNGAWDVMLENGETRRYGAVVIANGQHWSPRTPAFDGQFDGEIIHSRSYRDHRVLEGKRVLVVGSGNSAADIAVEAARVGRTSHLSMRRGVWLLPKTLLGRPTVDWLRPWIPMPLLRAMIKLLLRAGHGSYASYGLPQPADRLFDRDPTISDQLFCWLQHGRIVVHPAIRRIDGKVVEFTDGRKEEFDLICFATGYTPSFPFLPDGVVSWRGEDPQLVAGMFVPGFRNLYVFGIGKLRPIPRYGVGPPISAGAELLAACIRAQRELRCDLGELFRRAGGSPDRRKLLDPALVMALIRLCTRVVPWLPKLERLFDRRPPAVAPASELVDG